MPITNLMKDIVVNTLDEVLKQEKDERITDLGREEIIAYVLNRVQPKYVTSERGLLYGILDARHMVQQRVDILFLIHEAVHLISTRRDHHVKKKGEETEDSSFFFPHIVGRVLEESSLTVVPDLEVSLLYKESLAPMIDSDWDNPYRTNESTNGYYHFWPRHSGSRMGKDMAVSFTLSFRHPQCEDVQREVSLEALLRVGQVKTVFIPLVLVSASIGAGSSGE
jgi:competence protein ComFB